jgi:hypothetical protein
MLNRPGTPLKCGPRRFDFSTGRGIKCEPGLKGVELRRNVCSESKKRMWYMTVE